MKGCSFMREDKELFGMIRDSFWALFQKHMFMSMFVRLAWHDAMTFNGKGGANGSIRFEKELGYHYNHLLKSVVFYIEEKKREFRETSYADLIQISGITAIEFSGGPKIKFRFGRKDATELECADEGLLPDCTMGIRQLRKTAERIGMDDKEVLLLSGIHCLGRGWTQNNGFEGSWKNPIIFDNSYFVGLVEIR